jgi:4-alpha-glucanotransferase
MDKVDKRRYAGVLIPLFSLRSHKGLGIGEFLDLKTLIDWAKGAGLCLIQLLPIYDTTISKNWLDSYCYSALSMFALHPLYLRIEEAFSNISEEAMEEIFLNREKLNSLNFVDYEVVYKLKIYFCEKLFKAEDKNFFSTKKWKDFFTQNRSWLMPYAAFCVLRDHFGTSDSSAWQEWSIGSEKVIENLCDMSSPFYEKVCFYYFLQYQLDKQLKEVRLYADEKGVFLKGDFPVGVHRWSVDVWAESHLFDMKKNIGAPADYFNLGGQNWRLPAYSFEEIEKRNYDWFIRRLQQMQKYFHLVRIDHIFGYFRFWEIPHEYYRGALGRFNPSLALSFESLPLSVQKDLSRYTNPYITKEIVEKLFGEKADKIINNFLEKTKDGCYRFIDKYKQEEEIEKNTELSFEEKEGLHNLFSNVLLIQEGNTFYPRIGLEKTESFSYLSEDEQKACREWNSLYTSEEEELLWKRRALKILRTFKERTSMEICAEDLGMPPKYTQDVLEELGFLSLYIQRFSKKDGEEFALASAYEYLSVCSPSNHDTAPLRLWWKEERDVVDRFYKNVLKEEGSAPLELTEAICHKIIKMLLASSSRWAVFLLQDLFALTKRFCVQEPEEERINNPAIYPYYWRWRMPFFLEDLMEETDFSQLIKEMVDDSGR